jgi:CTP synthase (UTP-ammonia lyase)
MKNYCCGLITCSLVGQTATLQVAAGSRAATLYSQNEIRVTYFCNYGLNPAFRDAMTQGGMAITGSDANGEVRMIELPQHPFFMATLFLPQATSVPETPDPLIVGYLQAAMDCQV